MQKYLTVNIQEAKRASAILFMPTDLETVRLAK